MIRILIADDHPMFREGLRRILARCPDFDVAHEASNGQEVFEKVWKNEYDIVLLDIAMPRTPGLEVLKRLKTEKPKLPVLVLSMYPEEQYAVRVIKAGASGYLTKESASEELITAIRRISGGRKYITSSIAERLADDVETTADKPLHDILSDRELEVFRMVSEGKTTTQIAEGLLLSVKTISTYRSRILEKMKMKTNAELIHYAVKHNIFD